jgi:hypothetical protein
MNFNWVEIKAKLREDVLTLPHFLRNPVQGMRNLPNWDWPTLLILPPAFALACGMLKNLIDRDLIGFFLDIVVSPVASVVVTGLIAAWFFYGFKFVFHLEVPFRSIYTHVVFAAIPTQLTNIGTKYLPPVNVLGLAASIYLLHTGFTHSYQLDSRKLKKLFIALFSIYCLWWAAQIFKATYRHDGMRSKALPESLDILEKELNGTSSEGE